MKSVILILCYCALSALGEISISSVSHVSGAAWSQGSPPNDGLLIKDSASSINILGTVAVTGRVFNVSSSSSMAIAAGASINSASHVLLSNTNLQLTSSTSMVTVQPLASVQFYNIDVYVGAGASSLTVVGRLKSQRD